MSRSEHDPPEDSCGDEDQRNILASDNDNLNQCLLQLFQKHDEEDLKASLLPGESLRLHCSISSAQDHRATSP
ncbi:unnamed protein product, partial [Rotaria sp. Silwood2]